MRKLDMNCDLGESFGVYTLGMDEAVLPLISSCNIACGFHASDPLTMKKTVELAAKAGAGLGAHPGYPDLLGFGRRNMAVSPEETAAYLTYQVGALAAFAAAMGTRLQHVKPHGALYNQAAKSEALSLALARAVQAIDPTLIFLAPACSVTVEACRSIGLPVAQEVFADRAYQDDGTLVPRSQPGSVITDPEKAAARVVRMVTEGVVTTISGKDIPITADSVCVHGDNSHALDVVKTLRRALEQSGITIAPMHLDSLEGGRHD